MTPSTLSPLRPPLPRHGQTLTDYPALLQAAQDAVRDDPERRTQAEIARAIERSEGYVSKALRLSGARYAQVQKAIIALTSDYAVEEKQEVSFRFVRKSKA